MKYSFKIMLLSALFVLSMALVNQVQAQTEVIGHVSTSLKVGSSRELARDFNKTVELILDGEKSSYSKIQAELVLKDFLGKNPPKDFLIVHKGASREGLHYAIGRYVTQDQSYRVYMLLKLFDGEYRIDTIEFSKES